MNERELAKYLDTVGRKIDAFGWAVQGVGGSRTEPVTHYTVGLWPKHQFELLTFGLENMTGVRTLNVLAQRVVEGEAFTHGQVIEGVALQVKLMMVYVPSASRYLRTVAGFYGLERGTKVPAWQVVYTDPDHRWPWDEASDVGALPVLGAIPGHPKETP